MFACYDLGRDFVMTINKQLNGTELTVSLAGRIDTVTSPRLEEELRSASQGVTKLRVDFKGIEYISSAGLRVLLAAQKLMDTQGGTMTIENVNDEIMDIFEMTGFTDVLTFV
jgi:anti-sigma B factor antagonist